MYIFSKFIYFCCLIFSLSSCIHRTNPPSKENSSIVEYAQWLKIIPHKNYTICEVYNPWQKNTIAQTYILVDKHTPLPSPIPKGTLIRTPIERAGVFSSVHAALLTDMGKIDYIRGLCDCEYIQTPALQERLKTKKIIDLGSSLQPNLELIVSHRIDALLISPFKNMSYGGLLKLSVPIVECADYMETTPLGRAEWMKFYGLLFGCPSTATALFKNVTMRYNHLCRLVKTTHHRPMVMCDQKTGNSWFMPGGMSYLARLYNDAGMRYCFNKNKESGSVSFGFEKVWEQAHNADIWLIKSGMAKDVTYADLAQNFPPYTHFSAFEKHHVWYCNTIKTPYFEETPFYPNRLLCDLIKIAHPDLLPHYALRYYRPVK